MLLDNVTIRLLGSDDFPVEAKQQAAADLTLAAAEGADDPGRHLVPLGRSGRSA